MSGPAFHLVAVLELPSTDSRVFAGRGQQVGILPPSKARDRCRVASEPEVLATSLGLPHKDAAVAIAGRDQHAVGTEADRRHPVGVLLHLVDLLPSRGRVDANQSRGTANRDVFLVGADVGSEDLIRLFAQFDNSVAGLEIPDNDFAPIGAATAASQQELPAAAELQRPSDAFGERQDAHQLQRLSVVKQDLLLARNGDQWRPRIRAQRGHGSRSGRHNGRLQADSLRHRSRAFGSAVRSERQRQLHLRLLLQDRRTGLRLQCPRIDPLLDDGEHLSRQFFGVLRHVGLS